MGHICKTFTELQDIDADMFSAFSGFITVTDAKAKGIIPSSYVSYVPDTCTCGAETIITPDLLHIMCCNPRCYVKMGYNLLYLYRKFDISGIGPETCLDLCRAFIPNFELHSHLELLRLGNVDMPSHLIGSRGQTIESANKMILKKTMSFGTLVGTLGIPSWDTSSTKFLMKYDSVIMWLEDVEKYGGWKNYFSINLGIYDSMKRFYLYEYVKDIMYASSIFPPTIPRAHQDVHITLSGSLTPNGVRKTKAAYIQELNDMVPVVNGRKIFNFINNSAVNTNAYVISDEMHTKAQIAKRREETSKTKILYTSTEFINFVKDSIKGVQ